MKSESYNWNTSSNTSTIETASGSVGFRTDYLDPDLVAATRRRSPLFPITTGKLSIGNTEKELRDKIIDEATIEELFFAIREKLKEK